MSSLNHITMLGTGNALATRCYNTCFTLRGDYRGRILNWVHDHRPDLDELYRQIYTKKDRTYWSELGGQLRSYCEANGFRYVRNDDSLRAKHGELPVVVNYFYHEIITKSAQKQAITASAWQTHDGQQPD